MDALSNRITRENRELYPLLENVRPGGLRNVLRRQARKWMPPARPGRCSKVALDVEEGSARNVALEIGPPAEPRIVQGPPAIDKDVTHGCDRKAGSGVGRA